MAAREQRQLAEQLAGQLTGEAGEPARAGSGDDGLGRVLVVDDAQDTRELVALALAAAGFETTLAANGLEALIAAHTERPAVILMDVNMPVLDGIEATRLLKAAPATRQLPVIAHTAKPDVLEGPITRLFARVLAKPAGRDELIASVRAILSGPHQQRPGVAGS